MSEFDRISYQSMGLLTLGRLLLLLILLLPTMRAALPNCHSSEFFQILPLVPEEAFIMDLSTLFQGYNLQFNVTADPDILPYVKIGEKIKLKQQQFPDDPLLGLKSFFLDKKGNSWGQQFVALTERGDRTQIHSGILNDNDLVPVINFKVTVQNFTNTTCFDAVQVAASNLIIVDCVQRRTFKDSKGRMYQNIFYYFSINNGSKVKELVTEMYVPFQQFSRRKLLLYSDLLSSHTFLLRTYFADKMTDSTKDNTYLQVLMIQDPLSPWVVGLIDRTFLGVPKLRIIDVKVYLSEIYILDEIKGVYRVYISKSEDLHYQGCYEARGFKRLAVFSPNLDNHIEIAISNGHSIHEVDWTDLESPRLLNKYSLLPDSSVSQIFLNERFIFVRSSSSDSTSAIYDYTWTFTRGDRTFSRAFAVMKHESSNTMVDLNSELTYLMVIGEQKLTNYAYDDPSFILKLKQKEEFMDKVRTFTLNATSWDPNTADGNFTCSITINFTLLDPNNRTMWVVGRGPPQKYTANYPGKVHIELGQYVLGPNVTYRLRETKKGQLPKAKIYQQEQLLVRWQNSPPFESATFLQTQTFSGALADVVMIYIQNDQNIMFISKCFPSHESLDVNCTLVQSKDMGGKITNWGTSVVREPLSQEEHHVLGYTTTSFYNMVFLYDLSTGKEIKQLELEKGFPGNISSLAVSGKYMYTVLRHIKRVDIYPLEDCLDNKCVPICNLNHLSMYKLGLKYFAPRAVHASRFHPQLLFVKTDDSIIAVDLSKECVPRILAKVTPVENALTPFGFEINANYLVVTIQPDIIQEYDMSRIYLREVKMTKKYPLYGHKLPPNYNFDISDYGNCVYLSTLTEGGDYNVFVYRSGLPAVGSLYNQIDLYAFQHVLMDASGYGIDYVSIISGKEMRIFRQYQKPEGKVDNPKEDYQFYLEYFNSLDSAQLSLISVEIINLPTYITVNPFLKDIMNTRNLLYSGENKLNEIDDSDWYKGNVLYIRPTCGDCPEKVKVNNHIQLESKQKIIPTLTSFVYSSEGGQLLAQAFLLKMQNNGTLAQIVSLHANKRRRCLEVAVGTHFTVIGCQEDDTVSLQAVSSVGTKAFPFQQQEISAVEMVRLQVSHELVMLVDVDEDCYVKSRKGGIFLFQISDDLETDEPLAEIEYIDGDDFGMRELGNIYINNAQLIYLEENGLYRLYLTEMNRGLLIMEFQHLSGKADIVVRRTYFAELKSFIVGLGETLPYDATFQAVTLIESVRNSAVQMVTDRLLITTGRYHTIQLALTYDSKSNLVSKVVERFYLRYSFYDVSNEIKHINGLFLIRHSLSEEYNDGNRTRQLYTIYSTKGNFNGTIEKRGLIGALPLQESAIHRFDFNTTLDPDSGITEPRVGLVAVEEGGEVARGSLHLNFSLFTSELLDTQIIYLDLINDFSTQRIRILLNGMSPFPEWKLITIILFSIIGALILAGIAVVLIKKFLQAKGSMTEQRETLITQSSEM